MKVLGIILLVFTLAGVWYLLPRGPVQDDVYEKLKAAAQRDDYESFAANLKIAYEKGWVLETTETEETTGQNRNKFVQLESEAYIKETKFFDQGDLERALRVSTTVYKQVPNAWRFRYLRIRALEKYGRNAFEAGDLVKAEDYAKQILAMLYRPEGANLLGDIYIKKLEADIAAKNKTQAILDYNFISQYQLTEDRTKRINELRIEGEKL